jgi:hypothetical protein
MKLAGIILIVLGVIALCYQYIPVTETKQDLKIGDLSVQHQETHYYPVAIAGGVAVVAGLGCIFAGTRK